MSETKPSVPKPPQKMVSRSAALSLGIICIIILIAGLGLTVEYYTVKINDRDDQIASLNTQILGQKNTISTLTSRLNSTFWNLQDQVASVASLNANINSLNSTLTNLQKITNMQESTMIFNNSVDVPSSLGYIVYYNLIAIPPLLGFDFEGSPIPIDYAGYIFVNVVSSTSNSTFVELNYSSFGGLNYDNTMRVGSSGLAYFPILPTTSLNIVVANTDTSIDLNITSVTVIYYY